MWRDEARLRGTCFLVGRRAEWLTLGQAASRIGQIRKVVTEFLLQVHSLLDDKGKLLNLYGEDVELHRRNADLSTSILIVLGEIVRWMHDKPWSEFAPGFLSYWI